MKITIGKSMWVWTLAAFAAWGGMAGSARAAVVAYDDLESATLGSLGGQTSGTGFTAGYALASGAIGVVTNQSLSYSSGDITVDGGTNCVLIGYQTSGSVFSRAIPSQNSDTLYISFLFRTSTADGSSNEDFLSFGLGNAIGEPSAGIVHRFNSGVPSDHAFGIRTSLSTDVKGTLGTEVNRTYFVMLRLRKLTPGATQSYNELALFVDPSSNYEPAPTMVVTNTGWAAATFINARIASSEAGDKYFIDNFCVGDTYNSVVFPAGDGPVTEQPVITPRSGISAGLLTVTMSAPTAGSTIYYTTDGSTPSSTHGTVYTVPFTLNATARVQAIATSDGKSDSAITAVDYRILSVWLGAGADNNWSTVANWNPEVSPAGVDLVFGNVDRTASTVVNNIVAADLVVGSLCYSNSTLLAAVPTTSTWHVTEIGEGRTLTVDGSTNPGNAVLVGGIAVNGKYNTYAKMTGGGTLVVDADTSNFLMANPSKDNLASANLDLSGLSAFQASVSGFRVGYGQRTGGALTLPAVGDATSQITSSVLIVGDTNGGSDAGDNYLYLGRSNELNADNIYVGAGSSSYYQTARGYMSFQGLTGSPTPSVRIRAQDGVSRANLMIGYLGANSGQMLNRNLTAAVDFTGGTVDATFGQVLVGQHQAYSGGGKTGGASGTLSMSNGVIDATTVLLGRTIYRSSSGAEPALGTLNVKGGLFKAETLSLGNNYGSYDNTGRAHGIVNVSGAGTVEVDGDVTMGTRQGESPQVLGRVALNGGTMRVLGTMAPNSVYKTNIVSEVLLSGGSLFVTNAAKTATLRIENGTFGIAAGTAVLDRLVTTNSLTTTQVTLSGIDSGDYGQVTVNEDVRLGGTLNVVLNGYEIHGGESWTIVGGTGARTGTFAAISPALPEGMNLIYTPNGYKLVCPAQGTLLQIR